MKGSGFSCAFMLCVVYFYVFYYLCFYLLFFCDGVVEKEGEVVYE